MRLRQTSLPSVPRRDVVIAALFAAWGTGEVLVGAVSGPRALEILVALAVAAPLVWRTALPEVLVLSALAVAIKTGAGATMEGMALLTAVAFAAYSAGRHLPARRAAVTVSIMVVLVWAVIWRVPDPGPYDWVFVLLWLGGPGLAGGVFRAQLARAAGLADRAARAEMEREEHARAAVRSERDRIAREMHDTVAHAVSVMVLQTGAVRSRLPEAFAAEKEALDRCEETGRRAVTDLRRLLGLLRDDAKDDEDPADTEPSPTLARLDALAEESRVAGLIVDLVVEHPLPTLDPSLEVSAYRIVQEALTNVRKHAGASRAEVAVGFEDGAVRIRVRDDGRGRATMGGRGFGLVGIRERVEVYGGRLSAGRTDSGFVLDAVLPVGAP